MGVMVKGRNSSPGEGKLFLLFMPSRQIVGSTQLPIQWISGALSPSVKQLGREADHSPSNSAEEKYMDLYIPSPNCLLCIVVKQEENCACILTERFNFKKLNKVESKEKYCIEVSYRFTALENLDAEVEMIKENIKILAKQSLDYYESSHGSKKDAQNY
jgi:hypothetical protein